MTECHGEVIDSSGDVIDSSGEPTDSIDDMSMKVVLRVFDHQIDFHPVSREGVIQFDARLHCNISVVTVRDLVEDETFSETVVWTSDQAADLSVLTN